MSQLSSSSSCSSSSSEAGKGRQAAAVSSAARSDGYAALQAKPPATQPHSSSRWTTCHMQCMQWRPTHPHHSLVTCAVLRYSVVGLMVMPC